MALTHKHTQVDTATAGAAIGKHLFVGYDDLVCGALAKAKGVTPEYDIASGEDYGCISRGIVILTGSAAIAKGDPVSSTAAGKGVTTSNVTAVAPAGGTTVTAATATPSQTIAGGKLPQAINGYAVTACTGDGELFLCQLV